MTGQAQQCATCGRALYESNTTGLCLVHLREETARRVAARDKLILAELRAGRSRAEIASALGINRSRVDSTVYRHADQNVRLPTLRLATIIAAAAECAGVKPHELRGPRRCVKFVLARHAVALIGMEAGHSSTLVAQNLGKRHHTTIVHGRQAALERAERSPEYAAYLDAVHAGATRQASQPPSDAVALVETMVAVQHTLPPALRVQRARRRSKAKNDFGIFEAEQKDGDYRFHRAIVAGSLRLKTAVQAAGGHRA